MKKIITILLLTGTLPAFSQTIKDCNVYPSNLEENMGFESFDPATNTIKGAYFMVLADGENSEYATPPFAVKIYLYQANQDPIFIKTYNLDGIKHFGSFEFTKENINFSELNVPEGTYRVGIFVDADDSIQEDADDNAILFRSSITVTNSSKSPSAPAEKTEENDGWGW